MAETDALSKFDFSKVTGGGLFLKFVPGEPVVVRVLTVDPIVANESYEDKRTGETIVGTKFSFIVYNWTEEKAQILKATPNTAKRIGELHVDEDFGSDIRKVDLKITPPEKGEIKAYLIEVLPKAKELTNKIIKECAAIKLDEKVDGDRMSFYDPAKFNAESGYEKAKATAAALKGEVAEDGETVVEDIGDEPIDLGDIPF
jgi:hypothetical protein